MAGGKRIATLLKLLILICVFFISTSYLYMHAAQNKTSFYMPNKVCESITQDGRERNNSTNRPFPLLVHQIFFYVTDDVIPERLGKAQKTWIKKQELVYRLWDYTMVKGLIVSDYPWLLDVFESYSHWVRRADVARYVILHKYGGLYVDMDIQAVAKKNWTQMFNYIPDKIGTVLYNTQPFGVSNDLMVARPNDPFLLYVLCGLRDANRWYITPYFTTMLSTGPLYLYWRYKSYPDRDSIRVLDASFFDGKYVTHIRGAAWHQWDGALLWWIFSHRQKVALYTGCLVTVILLLVCVRKRCCCRSAGARDSKA